MLRRMSAEPANRSPAAKSFSAFRIHWRVRLFIKHFALGHDLAQQPISFFQPALQSLRRANNNVQWKRMIGHSSNANGRVQLV